MFESRCGSRRALKLNKLISLHVGTRSPDQCRSHHQKMVKHHKDVRGIIMHIIELENRYEDHGWLNHKKTLRIRSRGKRREGEQGQQGEAREEEPDSNSLWAVLASSHHHNS